MNRNRLPGLTYFEPKTIEEAVGIKKKFGKDAVILAGGTDVLPLLKRRNIDVRTVVNIKGIPEISRISFDDKGRIKIGAAVTIRSIMDSELIRSSFPLLAEAASSVAYNQIRNMATLGGNLCVENKCTFYNQSKFWWQSRPDCFKRGGNRCYEVKGGKRCFALAVGDTVPALIALDGAINIIGPNGQRQSTVATFYTGDGRKPYHLDDDEFVFSIEMGPPLDGHSLDDWHNGFLKKSKRGAVDFSFATMAVRLRPRGRRIEDIRIVLNGVSVKPIEAKMARSYLIGKDINMKNINDSVQLILKEAVPLSSIGTSVIVRRKLIGAIFKDLLSRLISVS
jgi:4-hydroxybenzoyl-CoA reductase subunit beta